MGHCLQISEGLFKPSPELSAARVLLFCFEICRRLPLTLAVPYHNWA